MQTQRPDDLILQKVLMERQTEDGVSQSFLHHGKTGLIVVGSLGKARLILEIKVSIADGIWVPVSDGEVLHRDMIELDYHLGGAKAYGMVQPLAQSVPGTYRFRLVGAQDGTVIWVYGVGM